jgi:hypothetical protein
MVRNTGSTDDRGLVEVFEKNITYFKSKSVRTKKIMILLDKSLS